MDYEKKLAELESVVKKLEDSTITLDAGIKLFEEGVALTKDCLSALEEYKAKIVSIQADANKLLEDVE